MIGFSGRESDAPLGIWGAIADQLGKKDFFKDYYTPPAAPGQNAWINLLKGEPTLIFLDELPPYMDNARAKVIGNSDLSVVTTTALANLLVAVNKAELSNVCVVISDLSASYEGGSGRLNQALDNLQKETNRSALRIEPVSAHGDELYHILRTRLFEKVADEQTVKQVAAEYAKAVRDAKQMDVTSASPDSYAAQLIESYPFHFSMRDLYARFKENPGFQQTRGIIRLMRIVVSSMYQSGRAAQVKLIHPYDLDLNNEEVFSEIKSINPSLDNAIVHDIADEGDAVVEQMDKQLGSGTNAQDVAKLLLVASLADIPGATHGLRESEIIGYLCAPGRDVSLVKKNVIDQLPTQAWYLHQSQDGRHFFQNTKNLAAELHGRVKSYNRESCIRELRDYLEGMFHPDLGDCYQRLYVLPAIDEAEVEADKVSLIITEPSDQPMQSKISADWERFANDIDYQNRVVFLTGSAVTMQRIVEQAAQYRGIRAILDEFEQGSVGALLAAPHAPTRDPQRVRAEQMHDKIQLSLRSAIQETFTTLVYPSSRGLRAADCRINFSDNHFDGEKLIRDTLLKVRKFADGQEISSDAFRKKCEDRLFGGQRVAPWSEIRRRAATNPEWQFHQPNALESLRDRCIGQDIWRDEGGLINRGPFPPPETDLRVQEMGRNDETGEVTLKITPVHGDTVYYEVGDSTPTPASKQVDSPNSFRTSELKLTFLCVDSTGEHNTGEAYTWNNKISLKHRVYQKGSDWVVELKATPHAEIFYTTDGSDPQSYGATYTDSFTIQENCRYVLAFAKKDGIVSSPEKIDVKQFLDRKVEVDPTKPVQWRFPSKNLSTADSYPFVNRLKKYEGVARGVTVDILSKNEEDQEINYQSSEHFPIDGEMLENTLAQLRAVITDSQVFINVQTITFYQGQKLLDWVADEKRQLLPGETTQ